MSEQLLTFEGVFETIRKSGAEFDRRLKESAAELDRLMKNQATEFDRRMQEADRRIEKTELQMKRTSREIGNLTGSMGRVIERMVGGRNIIKQFQEKFGYIIDSHSRNKNFGDALPDNMKGEIDLFLENGDIAILIEVKTTFKENDVGYLLNVIEKFRRYADFKGDKRRFMGAVAGAVIEEGAIKRAHENGFYVIAQSGKAMEILPTPEGFQAKEW
jgi:hypothetical protein